MSSPARTVVIVHNAVSTQDDPSTRDVLDQVRTVVDGLANLGLSHATMAVTGGRLDPALRATPGLVVFNLVESPPGRPRQQVDAAAELERRGIPFTGSSAAAIWRTTDKAVTRGLLTGAGLPVAPGGAIDPDAPAVLDRCPPPWVLKPACEDASLGLDGPLLCTDREQAVARAQELGRRFPGQPILLEHFLPGREFNLSLLADNGSVEVLPVAELVYVDFPEDVPRVLGWEAKWAHDSFAYTHTVRRFLEPDEADLAAELTTVARSAWAASGVGGYARVDLRLDETGTPCVLEVNANPCLSDDAGFMAAARQAGLGASAVVDRLLLAATGARS